MELREFVANSLSAILDGVEDAINNVPKDRKGKIAPIVAGEEDYLKAEMPIEFDIEVLCEEDKGTSGEKIIRIKVLPFEADDETAKTGESIGGSRIRFSVPIIYGGQLIRRT